MLGCLDAFSFHSFVQMKVLALVVVVCACFMVQRPIPFYCGTKVHKNLLAASNVVLAVGMCGSVTVPSCESSVAHCSRWAVLLA